MTRYKLLFVDDEKVDRMAFQRFARNHDLPYEYVVAASVAETWELLRTHQFDAVNAMKAGAYDYVIQEAGGNYLKTLSLTVENAIKRKQAELELQEYRTHLEEPVERRTGELRAEIEERKRIEEQLQASLQEKDVLLREIHHRVKNNLQSKNFSRIHFVTYVQNLISEIFFLYGTGEVKNRLTFPEHEIIFDIDTAMRCGLLISEQVSNALKYAFPEHREGEVWIELQSGHEGNYCLSIGDNGVGLPDDLDIANTSTLGLRLVHILSRQLHASLTCKRGHGTIWKICFAR